MSLIENGLIFDFKTSMEVYNNFKKFYNKRSIPSFYNFNKSLSNDQNLTNLSLHLLNVNSCTCTLFAYKSLIIELLARLIHNPQIERSYLESNKITQTIEGIHTLTALSLILSYTQEVSILTEHFLISKDFFHALKNCTNSINQFELQTLLLSFYRLINTDREKFYRFIDPQILHSLISNDSTSNINKYISIHILSKYLFLSEIVRNQMIQKNIDESNLIGKLDGDNNINFKFLSLLEAQRLSNLSKLTPIDDCFVESSSTIVFNQSDLSPGVNIISGIMLTNLISLKSNNLSSSSIKENNFVEIPKSLESIRSFAKCIKTSKPLLLIGSAGSGKTFLVDEMARRLQIEEANNLVKIHLNQQTDSKTLLGTYTSGTKPGTFEWKNGVLTTAVKEGKWVLIEDIDKAPNEVLSILMGLLEHRQITLPSRGEVFKAGNGFQLISTIRIKNNSKDEFQLPDMIGSRLWEVLHLKDLNEHDLKTILNKKFKLLTRYTDLFINCYFTVKSICDSRRFVSMNKGAQPREISIRDLMKFCRRSEHIFKLNDIKSANDLIHDDVFDTIFQEAIDCFTNAIVEKEPIEFLIREIGSILEIPSSRIELHLSKNVPSLENYEEFIKIGRAHIEKQKIIGAHKYQNIVANGNITSFATTNHSARLMEKIGVGISMCEPLLLVGETGTGKTTVVQQMAKMLNKKLTVINLSQQTEVGDLLGGFKPINAKTIALPLEEDFEQLFARSFSTKNNSQFLKLLSKCFNKSQWKNVCRLWKEAYKMAKNTFEKIESDDNETEDTTTQKKKRKLNNFEKSELMKEWKTMQDRVINFEKQVIDMNNSFLFRFVEGSLVNAVKKGDWLLLDEMNLAAPETLDSISDLLAEYQDQRSVLLSEKGDVDSIKAHPEFRIFGCMNPATDVGKKDLPQSIRSRFTEIYVASPDQDIEDLLMIIDKYIGKYALSDEWIGNDIAELYLTAKKLSDNNQIVDGANQKPHFSIRTLTRTLLYACEISPIYGLRRSLYEGFCMSLLTLLDAKSEQLLLPLIHQYTIGKLKNAKSVLSQIPSDPSTSTCKFIQFKHYWMQKGVEEPEPQAHYIITPFVEKNMMNLVRAISGGRFPVLIQGPTSAGKTSMINHLAKITGHKFVRINNHEHTDLQEYLGTYVSDDTGKLSFKEGILVEALRKGHWIVLDELNLAPTDVLEALNRLLDDNRELFIPETQEIVRPHPDFMLFATQNPPGLYGGRKVLSKAFRNRFLELHFDDIPQDELEIILRERCQIAPSYAKKIVEVYKELGLSRQSARLFEQKNSFATLRDLFRWAQREAVGYEQLAANGYMLLAERVRRPEEKVIVKQALENVMRVKLNMDEYYSNLEIKELFDIEGPVIWTKAMRRLAVLVMISMKNHEPLLLVGETGCGKTTVCQMIAKFYNKDLIIVNAHQNTETGDLLGAQRPIRNRSELQIIFVETLKQLVLKAGVSIPDGISYSDALAFWNDYKKNNEICPDDLKLVEKAKTNCEALFEWSDGPLINAMRSGSYFLLDEISLADDSVLERLNSVLEPERSLLLAEKGTDDIFITADEGFQFLATMNPGGDYGKKELSPALRNRFTEIWVPSMEDFEDVRQIVRAKLCDAVKHLTDIIVTFSRWYGNKMGGGDASSGVISLRDILAWITFINIATENGVSDMVSLLHGSCMVFIDALGTHSTAYLAENEEKLRATKLEYVRKLSEFAKQDLIQIYCTKYFVEILDSNLVCGPFKLERNENAPEVTSFNLAAPTTASNAMRVIRALQVNKPILLEGSPGVGKTSLITALAQATGNNLTRINLSEQTDLIDLFGSDSPVEGGKAGEFVWRDAPYLRAMQKGEWVLLDEMNLASQSVLEGLNACLDHRGEVYIPELDKSFISHPNFKVFAAQNPQLQGGGRKGLPKSFINRFSVVYVDMLTEIDLKLIAHHLYPSLDSNVCDKMISFMSRLEEQVVIKKEWGSSGAPWEFNLRDTLRWLSLIESPNFINKIVPSDFFDLVVKQRFRTDSDRQHAVDLFETIFGPIQKKDPYYLLQDNCVQCENVVVKRNDLIQYQSDAKIANLQCNVPILETIFRCIQHAYPLILVGASGSGKSNLIKFVADVIGSKVYEFSMNSDIDSMDILGGYEQADFIRTLSKYSNRIVQVSLKLIAVNVQLLAYESKVIVQIATKLIKFLNDSTLSHENIRFVLVELNSLNDIVQNQEINEIINALNKINESVLSGEISVNFEWFDGLLVEAVEQGYWLILDNANLCSPSVLDRLNSLLETNGSLIINECTNDDGSPRVIKTHPNFRLFLTSDPKYGELSRAMRNRSVEVYVDSLDIRASIIDRNILGLPQQVSIGDEPLNNELKFLDLKLQGKPIACYSLVSDSFLFSNSLFLDHYNTAISLQNSFAASSLLQFIPISLLDLAFEFSTTASNASEFLNSSFFINIHNQINVLLQSGLIDTAHTLYDKVAASSPLLTQSKLLAFSSQPVSFLTNSYILPLVKEYASFVDSCENSYLFAVLSMSSDAFIFMNDLHAKATTISASILNPLEKLAAVSLGREIKNVPKLNVYQWLVQILSFIKNQTSTLIKSKNFLNVNNCFASLFSLLVLWNNFVSAAKTLNNTAIRVYHDQLSEWYKDNISNFETGLFGDLNEFITFFSAELKLSRGSSMTIIWNSCRGIYPQTAVAWKNYESLVELASRFDKIAFEQFPENIPNVNKFREMFIQLFASCLEKSQKDDFDGMLKLIELKIEELEHISDEFLNKRSHSFVNNFAELLGFIESQKTFEKKGIELDHKTLTLCLLANKPTVEMVEHNKIELFKPYPKILKSLWSVDGTMKLPLFDDNFFKSTMSLVSEIEQTKGGDIEQTLHDLKFFISQMIANSPDVLSNHLSEFASIIKEWIFYIHTVHLDLLESDAKSAAEALFTESSFEAFSHYVHIFKSSGNDSYASIFEAYFVPSLRLLKQDLTLKSLGESYIFSACGFIMLYMPDSAYDPAAVDHILYNDFIQLQKVIGNIREAFIVGRENYFGDGKILADNYLPEIPQNNINEVPRVFRDSEPTERLFEEWQIFFTSYIDKQHINFLLRTASELTDKADAQINNFTKNATHFILRLKENHMKFSDLNDILIGFIYSLKLGIHLLHCGHKTANVSSPSLLWSSDAAVIYSPHKLENIFEHVQTFTKKCSVNDYNVESVCSYLLLLSKIYKNPRSVEKENDTFNKVLMTLYYRWSLRSLKQKEKESTESGVFKYEDPTMDAEADFKKLFPDSDDVIDVTANETHSSEQDLNEMYYIIAKAYVTYFKPDLTTSFDDISKNAISAFNSLQKITTISGNNRNKGSILVFILSLLKDSYNKFTNIKSSSEIDFYRGYDFAQTRAAGKVIRNVQISVAELLKKWPEHATLSELFRISTEFLEYSASTPIFRLLSKVEQIFTFIAEWEKYAHSGVSLSNHYKSVSGLIVSWRQLELASWKQVFVNEENNIEKNIGKWWFYLFESIILPTMNDQVFDEEIEIKVIAAINIFISQATYGEFSYRLDLISAFASHVKQLTPLSSINNSLLNIVNFYKQFISQINDSIAATKKDLEKKVNEVILLASWKDVNIDALKQSSRRSHHKLYSIIRKYRDCLVRPVKPLIEAGLSFSLKSQIEKSTIQKRFITLPEDVKLIEQLCSEVKPWNSRVARLKNISQVEKNMNLYVNEIDAIESRSLHDYAKEIFGEAERLRKETPSIYTKEKKKLIASLKTEKYKLMSNTITDLKTMGLKLHMTLDIQKALPSSTAILATSKSLENTSFKGCDAYFFRILDLLPRLRLAVSEVHTDIPPADAQKCLTASEHLLFNLLKNRTVLFKFGQFNSSLSEILSNLETFTTTSENKLIPASQLFKIKLCKNDFSYFVQHTPVVLDYAIESLKNSSEFTTKCYNMSVFINAKSFIEKYSVSRYELIGSIDEYQFQELLVFYNTLVDNLNEWKATNLEVKFVADFVLDWLTNQSYKLSTQSVELNKFGSLEDLEFALRELFNSILVSVQRIHKFNFKDKELNNNDEDDEEDDESNWLIKEQKKLNKFVDLLYPITILKRLNKCLEILQLIEYSEHESKLASAMLEHTLPIVQHYFNLVQIIQAKLHDNYIDISRGCYELSTVLFNICSKGFCQPEPPTDEKEDNNLKDGTGLGDGDGAENNSNDVEDDEDLSEQAQQPNEDKDKDDKEEDENDDAVDIKGDMAGDLENLSDQENEDDDAEEEKDEEELDEEIDDLDDMDPNAVDDKMWDEEASSNSKEKESENMPDNSEENNDMEAMEEDTQENESKENNNNDQDKNDDDNDGEEENQNDEDAEEEEDVGEQEDEVKDEQNDQFDNTAPEASALDLPEDMNLDSEGNESEGEEENDDRFDDNLDENEADLKDDDEEIDEKADVEMDKEQIEGDEESEEVEGAPADDNDGDEDNEDNEEEADADNMEVDNEEINEDAGEESEQELKDGAEENEDDSKDKNENDDAVKQEEIEGLEGTESGANDVEDDSAVKQQSGIKSEGADADANEDNENIGASNGGADFQNEEKENANEEEKTNEQNESSRDQAAESMKQLGDSLKEFYRRRQEIKEATDDDMVDQKGGERPDEFQHLEGDNADNDTQALGAANKDQVQTIDDNMEIDDEEEENLKEDNAIDGTDEGHVDNNEKNNEDIDMHNNDMNEDNFVGEKRSGFMSERNREIDELPTNMNMEIDSESEDESFEDEFGNKNIKPETDMRSYEEAEELWKKADEATRDLTSSLCEQLRLILEPTLSTKLKGDYKTGKRLNMKRIIPYIASQFRKDKIWMRRTKPSKRQYQIMISLDDSKSMSESHAVDIAFESVALVSKALSQLESGQLSIMKFGTDSEVVHPFEKQFGNNSGVNIFREFKFDDTRTDIKKLVSKSLRVFNEARAFGDSDLWQLEIVLSDGVCEDHETIQRLVRKAREEKVMIVFVIIDGLNSKESILDMSQASYTTDESGQMKLQVNKYLDTFPFEFYVVVHHINELPEMLSLILRQYFTELASS
jgi:midasin